VTDHLHHNEVPCEADAYLAPGGTDKKRRNRKRVPGSCREFAETFGGSRSKYQRRLERARHLDGLLEKISHTSLDSGPELDALCCLTTVERQTLVDRAAAGEFASARVVLAQHARDKGFANATKYEKKALLDLPSKLEPYLTHRGSNKKRSRGRQS
jgi:hypothetical protein